FLVGLLSLLDALLDRPMSFVTEQIPIPDRCKQALAGKRNSLGQTLTLAIACERGDWKALPVLCEEIGCSESQVFKALAEAQGWVHELSRQTEF
ncbi:MAG TPA: hypothetical protein VF786_02315, partial [Terriglobales bacterium]